MAPITGIGNAQLLRKQRIRNGKSVVVARMPLHIDRHRHVTANAVVAFGARRVVGMFLRLNDRGLHESSGMATQANGISLGPARMYRSRMTIKTGNASLTHFTTVKGSVLIILITNLAVRIEQVAMIHNRQVE